MLSRKDLEKEWGKGICLQPFHSDNIKENSVNLTLSHYAWSTKGGSYCIDKQGQYHVKNSGLAEPRDSFSIAKGSSCVVGKRSEQKVLLLPHQTTIVETSEVIAVSDYLGGTLHSKVGVVALGVGHIGTMLGPGYCGHMMISLHNITDDVIVLKVGETFLSVTFYYLETPVERTSATISGHVDKLAELGVQIDSATRQALTADWKASFVTVKAKMEATQNFKQYQMELKAQRKNAWKAFVNLHNAIMALVTLAVLVGFWAVAYMADQKLGTAVWTERFWNVGLSGVVVAALTAIWNSRKDNRR